MASREEPKNAGELTDSPAQAAEDAPRARTAPMTREERLALEDEALRSLIVPESEAMPALPQPDSLRFAPNLRAVPVTALDPPSLLIPTLQRHEIATVGDLLDVDPEAFASWPAVGAKKAEKLARLRSQARRFARPAPASPAPPPASTPNTDSAGFVLARLAAQGIPPLMPWEQVFTLMPTRSRNVLVAYNVKTVGELVAYVIDRPDEMATWENLGRTSLRQMREGILTVADRGLDVYVFGGVAPTRADELFDRMVAVLSERAQTIVERRYLEGATLEAISAPLDLTTERVRQILIGSVSGLRARFGDAARVLLGPLVEAIDARGGLIHIDEVRARFGVAEPGEVRLGLEVATDQRAWIWRQRFVTQLARGELEEAVSAFRQAVKETQRQILSWARLQRLLEDSAGFALETEALCDFVEQVLDGEVDEAGFRPKRTLTDELAAALFELGRPVETAELVTIYQSLAGEDDSDDESEETTPEAQRAAAHRVRAAALRHPDVWPTGRGLYVHTAHLGFDIDALYDLADRAVARLDGEPGPMSVDLLLTDLDPAGRFAEVNPHTFKHLLSRLPEILSLRSSKLVAHAASYRERGVTMVDRVEAVLLGAAKALSVREVIHGLPAGIEYYEVTVQGALARADWCLNVGRGRYVHRERTGLTPQQTESLVDQAISCLPADGSPLHVSQLFTAALASRPDLAPRAEVKVEPGGILWGLLRGDRRVIVERSGMVGPAEGPAGERLLEHAITEVVQEQRQTSPAEIRRALREDFGFTGSEHTVYSALVRLVDRGIVRRFGEGRYGV